MMIVTWIFDFQQTIYDDAQDWHNTPLYIMHTQLLVDPKATLGKYNTVTLYYDEISNPSKYMHI
jgi:hypothetical protein